MQQKTNNWQTKKLGEVCSIQTGKYDANHAKPHGKYRFYTCAFDYLYCDTNRFKGECIILPGNGANVGEVFYYNGEFDAYQRTYVLNEIKTDAKYLFYHLLGNWKNINKDKQYGSATNYIRMANFTDYDIPFPPLETQHAIVSKIEELFSELDKGIAELKTAQQQLKTYRQSVLKSAFEGKLTNENVKDGELPDGWKKTKVIDVALKVTDGEHSTPKRTDKGYYLLSARNIQNGFLALDNVDYIPVDEYNRITKRCNPQEGDILISCSGSVGRICRVPKNIQFGMVRSVALLKLDWEKFNSKYFEFLFQSPFLQKQIEKGKKATAQANLFLGPIKNLDLVFPSLEEQHRIVQEIESRLSVADKMEQSIQESLQKAEALRQSILKKAFCGELV